MIFLLVSSRTNNTYVVSVTIGAKKTLAGIDSFVWSRTLTICRQCSAHVVKRRLRKSSHFMKTSENAHASPASGNTRHWVPAHRSHSGVPENLVALVLGGTKDKYARVKGDMWDLLPRSVRVRYCSMQCQSFSHERTWMTRGPTTTGVGRAFFRFLIRNDITAWRRARRPATGAIPGGGCWESRPG
jgi:hypothetical protein